jgi:hypothetical protein
MKKAGGCYDVKRQEKGGDMDLPTPHTSSQGQEVVLLKNTYMTQGLG